MDKNTGEEVAVIENITNKPHYLLSHFEPQIRIKRKDGTFTIVAADRIIKK